MTAHELAKKLLEGPDIPVTCESQGDDPEEVSFLIETSDIYWDEHEMKKGPHINLS